jgi:hypothetical protein
MEFLVISQTSIHGVTGTTTVGRSVDVTEDIKGGIMLPAYRENIELHTEDGLTLVGEIAIPLSG